MRALHVRCGYLVDLDTMWIRQQMVTHFLFIFLTSLRLHENLLGGIHLGVFNDVWKAVSLSQCPPLHQEINETCVSLVQCSVDSSGPNCALKCDPSLIVGSTCLVEGTISLDNTIITTNGSVVEAKNITLFGDIKVSGDVIISGNLTLTLSPNAVLDVEQCFVVEDDARVALMVNEEVENEKIIAYYNTDCSSKIMQKLDIISLVDECEYGKPIVMQHDEHEGHHEKRTHLMIHFIPVEDCSTASKLVIFNFAFLIALVIFVLF